MKAIIATKFIANNKSSNDLTGVGFFTFINEFEKESTIEINFETFNDYANILRIIDSVERDIERKIVNKLKHQINTIFDNLFLLGRIL